jgi:hypothetical protein
MLQDGSVTRCGWGGSWMRKVSQANLLIQFTGVLFDFQCYVGVIFFWFDFPCLTRIEHLKNMEISRIYVSGSNIGSIHILPTKDIPPYIDWPLNLDLVLQVVSERGDIFAERVF